MTVDRGLAETPAEEARRFNHDADNPNESVTMSGFTLWFTGLSGAGKTTIATRVEEILRERGHNVELLDGDEVRTHLSAGLGFSKEDRDTNVRRIGWICRLLTRNDAVAIASAISPYRAVRDEVRRKIGRFVEVHVDCPLDVLKERDPKGLYAKALRGEIDNFTGISDPYEPPTDAEVVCDTARESTEESVAKVIRTLEVIGYVRPTEEHEDFTPEEEERIKDRLRSLGYL